MTKFSTAVKMNEPQEVIRPPAALTNKRCLEAKVADNDINLAHAAPQPETVPNSESRGN